MTEEPCRPFRILPVDLDLSFRHLELGLTETAKLCQVSIRQLMYWVDHGYVPCEGGARSHTFNAASIEKICLIKQGLEKGFTLKRAAELAESFLHRKAAEREALKALSDEALKHLVEVRTDRMRQLADRIRRGLRAYRAGPSGLVKLTAPEELGQLIAFLEGNPYLIHTAKQICLRLGRPHHQVKQELDLLAEKRFLQRIAYPGTDVYRYLPPRRSLS